nr:IPExxxVDY family protein [Flavobacteriales bacterium]
TSHRHILEIICEDEFALLAIHCHEEDYNFAFFLNKYLGLSLKKKEKDLDLLQKNIPVSFPLFEHRDESTENVIFLVGNRFKTTYQKTTSAGSLFAQENEEKTYYLIPEYKKTDYFLKIISDSPKDVEELFLSKVIKIPIVITAYSLDYTILKSKQNLNFD